MVTSDLLENPEQLTAEWLTRRLQQNGYLADGEVLSILSKPLQKQHRSLLVTYSSQVEEPLPRKFILKWYPSTYPHGVNEGWFYRQVASAMPISPAPACYDVVIDDASWQTHILLADLSDTYFMPTFPFNQLSEQQVLSIVDAYCQFHAFWWDHPRIFQDNFLKARGSEVTHAATSISVIQESQCYFADKALPRWMDQYKAYIQPEWQTICEKSITAWADLFSQRIANKKTLTLIQGDAHLNNVLLPRQQGRRSILIDWEGWIRGVGVWDLARMLLISQFPVAKRRSLEQKLLSHYHTRLTELCVDNYRLQNCHDDYRLCVLANIPHVLAYGDPPYMESAMQAFRDWHCEELLA
ncbi:MAG: oxidoreductase family protein [Chloroflexota bacterium]